MPPAGPGIQSCKPEKADASVANVKGHDYYKDTFSPPEEVVTEIDPRDKVGVFWSGLWFVVYFPGVDCCFLSRDM